MKTTFAWLFLIIGTLFGLLFLGLVLSLYRDYLNCNYGSSCYDKLVGPAVFSLFSAPSWALSSLGIFMLRDKINKPIRMISYLTCGFMFLAALYFLTVL